MVLYDADYEVFCESIKRREGEREEIAKTINKGQMPILRGNIIEYYSDDYPIPSVLLATLQPEPLHAVGAYDAESQQCHIIIAYRPDLTHFEADLITRRLL